MPRVWGGTGRREGLTVRTQSIFSAVKLLYMVDSCRYAFVKHHRTTQYRVNPNGKYKLQLIILLTLIIILNQFQYIHFNKVPQ